MAETPRILQDEFSINQGSATFRLIWTNPISSHDKADLLDWLKLVERRISRLPDVGPVAAGASSHQEQPGTGRKGEA